MKNLITLSIACAALVASLAYTAHAQFGSTGGFTVPQQTGGLPITGGTMSGDIDMSGNNLTNVGYYESNAADPADTGAIRLGNNECIVFEASPTGNDETFCVNSSENFYFSDNLETTGSVLTSGNVRVLPTGWLYFNGRAELSSQADGQLCGSNDARSSGACLDFDDVNGNITIKDFAGTGDGTLTIGSGGQWKAGTADSMICLQEVDTATDQICLSTINDNLHLLDGAGAYADLLTATITSAAATPYVVIRDDTSPGTDAGVAYLYLQAYDAAGTPNIETYAQVELDVTDATDASEDADIALSTMSGGSLTEFMRLDGDASNVAVTGSLSTTGSVDATGSLTSQSTINSSVATGGVLYLTDTTDNGAADAGHIYFRSKDSGGANDIMVDIEMDVISNTAGAENVDMVFSTRDGTGSRPEFMRLDGDAGGITLNGNSAVLMGGVGDNAIVLQEVDTPTDNVCLFTNGDELWVRGGDCAAATAVQAGTIRASDPTAAHLIVNDSTGVGTTGAFAELNFQANDAGSATHDMATLRLEVTSVTAGAEYADLVVEATTNGTDATEYLRIDSSAGTLAQSAIGGDTKGAKTIQGGAYEDLTTNGGAGPFTTSGLIPDGAFLIGITTRVTTALVTCTDYSVGDGSDPDLYGVAGAVTQGTTTDNSDATANFSNPQLAAGEVTITTTGTCNSGGVIRVVAHYFTVGAPTSN